VRLLGRRVAVLSAGRVGADGSCRSGQAKGLILGGSVSTHACSSSSVDWLSMSVW